ncbi:MAG: transcription antitermination factor NusB [Pseudomonadota bacterium]|nr:transcription antitermination factor NusB [Pseudomonadota bacterium]
MNIHTEPQPPINKRSASRELVFQSIYTAHLSSEPVMKVYEDVVQDRKHDRSYAKKLLCLYDQHIDELNQALKGKINTLKASTLSEVERSIVLMATIEILYMPNVPSKVCINEAIILAKNYGAPGGYRLVNGILDQVTKAYRSQASS